MKKSARVSEKLVSPGLPGLQVATRLYMLGSYKFTVIQLLNISRGGSCKEITLFRVSVNIELILLKAGIIHGEVS